MAGTPSIQVADEWDAGFTTNALEVFAKSTDLAVKVRSNEGELSFRLHLITL